MEVMSSDLAHDANQRGTLISATLACSLTRLPAVDDQRIRVARRVSQVTAAGASGFTLVELLVTIVILGVLSGVVVFAVGGLQSKSQSSACANDRSALETAMETYRALNGTYATEGELVAAGQLRGESSMYDVMLGDGSYTLTPVGPCAEDGSIAAASAGGDSPPTTPTTAVAPTPTSSLPATTTTTAPAPTTTTTTAPLRVLSLSSVCTDHAHWPAERAWQIKNRNLVSVPFTLVAVNATNHAGSRVESDAPPGSSTWYLPTADRGRNTATLDALGRHRSVNSRNKQCS
jgi:prepilin-type N-terminal cleavage/methylation domain-containing protein